MLVSIIVEVDNQFGISKDNITPWDLSEKEKQFSNFTKNKTIITGKYTYKNIPSDSYKELIVVTTESLNDDTVKQADTVKEALEKASYHAFILNGDEKIFQEAIQYADTIFLTHVFGKYNCDAFFPALNWRWEINYSSNVLQENGYSYRNLMIIPSERIESQEQSYLQVLYNTLYNGEERFDRTGTGTIGTFANTISFDMSDGTIPLLTTKRVPMRIVLEELLWFLRGETNAKTLQNKNVHIWDGNSSREFLDKRGLADYSEGQLGPIYGAQWRNFNGQGYDQIKKLEETLKNDPTSRRMIVSAWNPNQLHEMALQPCHVLFQLYVCNQSKLHMRVDQRSADMFLGIPFNLASYGILTFLLAKRNGYKPGMLHIQLGDTHIYNNHINQVKEQLQREQLMSPKLHVNDNVKKKEIDNISINDFTLIGYFPKPTIKAEMCV